MIADDRGIADAFYTVLSAGIVVLAGLTISAIVLNMAGQQGQAVADRLDSPDGAGLKKGLYAFYYTVGPSADLSSADPNQIPPGDYVAMRAEPSISLGKSSLPPDAPASRGMAIWTGYIMVNNDGDYTFKLDSAGGSWLWVDGVMIADNHGAHPRLAVYSAVIHLKEGRHTVKARYFYTDAENSFCRVLINAGGIWSGPAYYR